MMRHVHGYCGRALLNAGKNWGVFPLADRTYKRIKKDKKFAEHLSKGANTLNPVEDLHIGQLGSKTVRLATCQFIMLLGMWCAGRGLDPLKTLNKHVTFESDRKVCGVLRPRVSHNFRTDKTHRQADVVANSEAETLEKAVECGCPEGCPHSQDNSLCQISGVVSYFEFKNAVWRKYYAEQRKLGVSNDVIKENWENL